MIRITLLCSLLALLVGCATQTPNSAVELIPRENFDTTLSGKQVSLYTLTNTQGLVCQITNYGGRVVALWTPDREGVMADIVLGYDSIEGYLASHEIYYGALIGRYGNRIQDSKFTLEGREYTLQANERGNALHGGKTGFQDVVWEARPMAQNSLELGYTSPDGEGGFPATLTTRVIYELTDRNELRIEYFATADAPTHLNLTHHSFFNLHGAGVGTVNDHEVMICADSFTPTDPELMPTGEILSVEGTPMDFRVPTRVGERVDSDYQPLNYAKGYDHNWVLSTGGDTTELAASAYEPLSGRTLEVYTDQPAFQFYGGNVLDGRDRGKGGRAYNLRSAFCFETQHCPDSPNLPQFPSTLLLPEQEYHHLCIYRFGVK